MNKNFGKMAFGATKAVITTGVGIATAAVTEIICDAYAPAGTAPAVRKVMYKVGTKGLSMVTGAIAADATLEKLEKYERVFIKKEESEEPKEEKAHLEILEGKDH